MTGLRPRPLRAVGAAASLAAVLLAGCAEERPESRLPREPRTDPGPAIRPGREPDALLVRFREMKGTGFSREGWEIEVLQMGSDVRLRGAVRTGGQSVPVFQPMEPSVYAEFWRWLKQFPLDRHQVQIDPTRPEAEWTKSLEVDVVLGPEERWISRNTWTRPLVADDWAVQVENRLHGMVLDLAEAEISRMRANPMPRPPPLDDTVQRTLDALADTGTAVLPPLDGTSGDGPPGAVPPADPAGE